MPLKSTQWLIVIGIISSSLNSSFLADTWTCFFTADWAMKEIFSDFKTLTPTLF